MKFKNYEVEPLGRTLFNLALKGTETRMRTRFVNLLDAQLSNVIGAERQALINQYAKKNEIGDLIRSKENQDIIELEESTQQEFYYELDTLMNEYFYIEENEANKMMILSVAEMMIKGDFEVSGDVAAMYDKWYEQFERVVVDYGGEA